MKRPFGYGAYSKNRHKRGVRPLVWSIFAVLLKLAQAPEPEALNPEQQKAAGMRSASTSWGWFPPLALISAVGLLVIAHGFNLSMNGGLSRLRSFIYPGLLLIFTPTAIRLIAPSASRRERIGLVIMTGMYCYFVKVMVSPLRYHLYDEFLHFRTANDIGVSGHLFTPNALLPVSPYYPGLETATSALSMMSGLSTFYSSLILIGVVRLMMTLSLFALNEEVFHSARTASIATMLYMVNPHYLFFDTQFAYESLALPLGLTILLIMAPYQSEILQLMRVKALASSTTFLPGSSKGCVAADYRQLKGSIRAMTFMALLVLGAVTLTHHATDYFLLGMLIVWAIIFSSRRLVSIFRSRLVWLVVMGIVFAGLCINNAGNPVVVYLTGFLSSVFSHAGKHFVARSVNAYGAQPWERNLAQFSTYFMMVCLPFGLLCLWQRFRSHSLAWTLGLISLGFPASQVLRVSDDGIQLADRASALLFIAISSVLAVLIVQFWPTRRIKWFHCFSIAAVVSVLFLGGYISSGGSGYGSPPTPYVIGADSRSIEAEGIQAAAWTLSYLGPNNRFGADRTNQLLMASYGDQRIVDIIADHVDLATIFFSFPLGPDEINLMKRGKLHYLEVDQRLSQGLPVVGFYYEKDEPGAFQHETPVELRALTKFNTIPGVNRVFDSGDIVIYDVGKLGNAR